MNAFAQVRACDADGLACRPGIDPACVSALAVVGCVPPTCANVSPTVEKRWTLATLLRTICGLRTGPTSPLTRIELARRVARDLMTLPPSLERGLALVEAAHLQVTAAPTRSPEPLPGPGREG